MDLWGGLANNPMYTGTRMGVDFIQKAMNALADSQKSTILYNDGGVVHLPDFPLVADSEYITKTPGLYLYDFSPYGFNITKATFLHTKDGGEIPNASLHRFSPAQIFVTYTPDSLFADMPVAYADLTIVDTNILDMLNKSRLHEPVSFLYLYLQSIQHMERLPINAHAIVLYAPKSYLCKNLVAYTEATLGAPLSPVNGVVTDVKDNSVTLLEVGKIKPTNISLDPYGGAVSVRAGDTVEAYEPLVNFLSCHKGYSGYTRPIRQVVKKNIPYGIQGLLTNLITINTFPELQGFFTHLLTKDLSYQSFLNKETIIDTPYTMDSFLTNLITTEGSYSSFLTELKTEQTSYQSLITNLMTTQNSFNIQTFLTDLETGQVPYQAFLDRQMTTVAVRLGPTDFTTLGIPDDMWESYDDSAIYFQDDYGNDLPFIRSAYDATRQAALYLVNAPENDVININVKFDINSEDRASSSGDCVDWRIPARGNMYDYSGNTADLSTPNGSWRGASISYVYGSNYVRISQSSGYNSGPTLPAPDLGDSILFTAKAGTWNSNYIATNQGIKWEGYIDTTKETKVWVTSTDETCKEYLNGVYNQSLQKTQYDDHFFLIYMCSGCYVDMYEYIRFNRQLTEEEIGALYNNNGHTVNVVIS